MHACHGITAAGVAVTPAATGKNPRTRKNNRRIFRSCLSYKRRAILPEQARSLCKVRYTERTPALKELGDTRYHTYRYPRRNLSSQGVSTGKSPFSACRYRLARKGF